MANEITFDTSSGPMMKGTWVNPSNGDVFTVRETFFQDNQLIVQTMDGRMLDYNFISNYIQCEEKDAKAIIEQSKQKTKKVQETYIPDEVKELIDNHDPVGELGEPGYIIPEDEILFTKTTPNPAPTGNLFTKPVETPKVVVGKQSEDDLFIHRVLGKTNSPRIKVSIDWPDFPEEKINMLTMLLDVDSESIANWYRKDVDVDSIKEEIKKSITDFINNPVSQKKPQPTSVPEAKTTKRGRPKKTNK